MRNSADKTSHEKSQTVVNAASNVQPGAKSALPLQDNRPEAPAQRKWQEMANNSPQAKQAAQLQAMANNYVLQKKSAARKENLTGLANHRETGTVQLMGEVVQFNGWEIAAVVAAVKGTAYGAGILKALEESPWQWNIIKGNATMTFVNAQREHVIMVNEALEFDRAVLAFVQELSNATIHKQLQTVESLARWGKISEAQYVEAVERGEYIGAQGSNKVFEEASAKGEAWTKDKKPNWPSDFMEDFGKYFKHLEDTGATQVYHNRYKAYLLDRAKAAKVI